jgi:tRNA-Thr(GGU) m(6)t(6)A37 methyltransferase TsaA
LTLLSGPIDFRRKTNRDAACLDMGCKNALWPELDSKEMTMPITLHAIGVAHTDAEDIPRHWTVSDVEGTLVIDPAYTGGLADIAAGQRIVVLFHFHQSPPFSKNLLKQTPPHRDRTMGVFSICSPRRPNPIGMSVLDVVAREDNVLRVRGMDMRDGTPILDIKPFVTGEEVLPSRKRD